jgi:hypothetical protein
MKRHAILFILPLMTAPVLAEDTVPPGWNFYMSPKGAYVAGTETLPDMPGRKVAFLRAAVAVDPARSGSGLSHVVTATSYKGRRLRVSTRLKTEKAGVSRCYLGVLRGNLVLQGANVPIAAGTHDWTDCNVVLDVPKEATGLRVGINLNGGGTVWSDGFHFEAVGKTVALTEDRQPMEHPVNLDFDP